MVFCELRNLIHDINLCTPGVEKSKVTAFLNFLESNEKILNLYTPLRCVFAFVP